MQYHSDASNAYHAEKKSLVLQYETQCSNNNSQQQYQLQGRSNQIDRPLGNERTVGNSK